MPRAIQEFYQSECLKTEVSYFSTKKSNSLKLCLHFNAPDKNHFKPLHQLPTSHAQFLEFSNLRQQSELDGMTCQVNSFQFLQSEMYLVFKLK